MKRTINRFITGEEVLNREELTPLGSRWCDAVGAWQVSIIQEVRLAGEVRTVSGRRIPVNNRF